MYYCYSIDLIEHIDYIAVFLSLVPQQGVLLHAAADWGDMSNRSSRCPYSSAHMDHSSPTTSGNTAVSLFFSSAILYFLKNFFFFYNK